VFVVIGVPELRTVVGQEVVNEPLMSDEAGMHHALKNCLHSLMTCPKETIKRQLQILLRRLASLGMGQFDIFHILFSLAQLCGDSFRMIL
jgi:hypothetical protein